MSLKEYSEMSLQGRERKENLMNVKFRDIIGIQGFGYEGINPKLVKEGTLNAEIWLGNFGQVSDGRLLIVDLDAVHVKTIAEQFLDIEFGPGLRDEKLKAYLIKQEDWDKLWDLHSCF
jgi:hypothetical protein